MPRRKTKDVNGYRRKKQRGQPQYSTVAAMEQAKADKCREARLHSWYSIFSDLGHYPDPARQVLLALIAGMEKEIDNHRRST